MAMTEEQREIALRVGRDVAQTMQLNEPDGFIEFATRFLAALPKPEPVAYRTKRGAVYAGKHFGPTDTPLYTEAPIAPPASEPGDTCFDDIKLAEMILSDCGCSTINNRSLVERVADRIARHKAPPASEQKPVAWVVENELLKSRSVKFDEEVSVAWMRSHNYTLTPLYAAPQPDYKAQRDALLDFANHIATAPKLVGTGWQEMAQMVVASVKGGA